MGNDDNMKQNLAQKLDLSLILGRSRDDDRLMLDDETILAALDGSRPLLVEEREALQRSPITLMRFRNLALQVRTRKSGAANDEQWQRSHGMLRAAASGDIVLSLSSDDHYWKLDFVPEDEGWQFILSLDVNAPFANQLLSDDKLLRVLDGNDGLLLEGRLDADGECEVRWPHATEPGRHLQQAGARFRIELCRTR